MNKYFKNFILCGDIDYFCLLCEESFQAVDDLEKHIRWEKHRKSIKSLTCMPKFKKDSIYKIDNNYYCETCNYLMLTIAEVTQHIADKKHNQTNVDPVTEAKGTLCKREKGLIVMGPLEVTNKDWNGVVDRQCMLCDVVVDNFVKHISQSTHMINIIKSEIYKTDGEQYYRKLNEDKSYCFVCKNKFSTQSANNHWNDSYHLEKIKKNEENTKKDLNKKLDVAVKLITSQKDFFDIDLENKVAMCKICTAYVNINFQFMIEHKKMHDITNMDKVEQAYVDMEEVIESLKLKKPEEEAHCLCIYDHGKRRSELAKFGKSNFIKMVPPGSRGYCSLCNTYISAHMNNFTEHVRGQIHMGHLELKGLDKCIKPHMKCSHKTKPLKDFLRTVVHISELNILWINRRICVDVFNFMLITIIDKEAVRKQVMCYACDVVYDQEKELNHCQTEKHKEAFLNTKVLTSINGEFIREIRSNLYHCSICNLTFPFWETMDKHLKSWKHTFTKNDKSVMYKLTETWYGDTNLPNLNHEILYPHLIGLGIL